MPQSLITAGMLAGGLGLFLLAVSMITDGLKLAAGNTLRNLLARSTRSPGRGILSGITITAIVQSSSAVTVATIGFVNAGLLSLYQALGVVYGANIGTTMTGWLVAIIGFKIKVELFALPMIGVGMLLRLTGHGSRRGALGLALAGFGLFFIGIDVLKEAFEGLTETIDLQRLSVDGESRLVLFTAIGFVMTLLTQSSSAAIAITLTATTGGILGLYAAAAMVIGANLGTTSTAAFAVIGATPNAKRVAAAHVVFNVLTGIVALLMLPGLFWVVQNTGKALGLQDIPAVTLALFHTTFNVLGVLLMWPASRLLTRYLNNRFVTQEEVEGRARYLDPTVAVSPALALNALGMELGRIGEVVRRMSKAALSHEGAPDKELESDRVIIEQLSNAVGDFISRVQRASLPEDIAQELPKVLRSSHYYMMASDLACEIAQQQSDVRDIEHAAVLQKLRLFRSDVIHLLDASDVQSEGFSLTDCENRLQALQTDYQDLKALILQAGVVRGIDHGRLSLLLEQTSNTRRLAEQMTKAARYLSELFIIANMSGKTRETAPEKEEKQTEAA